MRTRDDYDRAIRVVREVIHRWDPYSLLAGGCPLDEFDGEIAAVVAQIPRIRSPADAAHALSRVFSSAFEPGLFRPEHCEKEGADLYKALSSEGLLPVAAQPGAGPDPSLW
jgi:hypothetical protein